MKSFLTSLAVMAALVLCAGVKPLSSDAIDWEFKGDIHWQCEGREFCNSTSAGYVMMTEKLSPYAKSYTFEMNVKPVDKPTS